jgi:hypothetical protein
MSDLLMHARQGRTPRHCADIQAPTSQKFSGIRHLAEHRSPGERFGTLHVWHCSYLSGSCPGKRIALQ